MIVRNGECIGEKMPDFGHPIQEKLDQERELQDKDHLSPQLRQQLTKR